MVWFGIFLYLLVSSLKIRFCEQSVFAKSPLLQSATITNFSFPYENDESTNFTFSRLVQAITCGVVVARLPVPPPRLSSPPLPAAADSMPAQDPAPPDLA